MAFEGEQQQQQQHRPQTRVNNGQCAQKDSVLPRNRNWSTKLRTGSAASLANTTNVRSCWNESQPDEGYDRKSSYSSP